MHNNVISLSTTATSKEIRLLKFELLPQPLPPRTPHKPELTPSVYHIFKPLKVFLRRRRFASVNEVNDAVPTWLQSQRGTFLAGGIRRLVNHMH